MVYYGNLTVVTGCSGDLPTVDVAVVRSDFPQEPQLLQPLDSDSPGG